MPDPPAKPTQLQLAASRFSNISTGETKLFEAVAVGTDANCSGLAEKDRVIRGDCLSWLCTDPKASSHVTYRGVSIVGAEIDGIVDLEWAKNFVPASGTKLRFQA
jgi:hypothetical protein